MHLATSAHAGTIGEGVCRLNELRRFGLTIVIVLCTGAVVSAGSLGTQK